MPIRLRTPEAIRDLIAKARKERDQCALEVFAPLRPNTLLTQVVNFSPKTAALSPDLMDATFCGSNLTQVRAHGLEAAHLMPIGRQCMNVRSQLESMHKPKVSTPVNWSRRPSLAFGMGVSIAAGSSSVELALTLRFSTLRNLLLAL